MCSSDLNYKIVTPVATIGVRGTVFHVKCDDNGCQVVLQEGGVTLQLADGTTTDIDQPGWGIAITPTGFVGVPMQWPGGAGDPFGAGWQQFADAGAPQTTGATGPAFSSPLFSAFFSPSSNVVPPCLTPSCN